MPLSAMALTEARDVLATARDLVRWSASEFERAGLTFGHGTDNALDEAFYLVLWTLKLPPDLPAVYLECAVTRSERENVLDLIQRRIDSRRPAAYLTGEAWFAGRQFEVDDRVLVPRSPIAELIAAAYQPWMQSPPQSILDLCAGSGCIGIASALTFPQARLDLVELDPGAAIVCSRNLLRHQLRDRAKLSVGDLFDPVEDGRYDLIVSNPPYVPESEWMDLPPEYHHEPKLALTGGVDGMDVVARILRNAADHLTTDGMLVCEIGGSREQFESRFPQFPAIWPEFEHGGDGVFLICREKLLAWRRNAMATPHEIGSL